MSKSLGVYGLLNSYVFAGIAADVRQRLHFRFHDREVHELQQMIFLVANDGEKAIRDVMEPLCLTVPGSVPVLDASIIHRWPDSLKVELRSAPATTGAIGICFEFPLLNKGEFFVAKLLLSGSLPVESISFSLLAEDLPRALRVKPAPPAAVRDAGYRFDWTFAGLAAAIFLFLFWVCRCLYVLRQSRPELFPFPFAGFHPSLESAFLVAGAVIVISILAILGIALAGAAAFGGEFPPQRGPRFPLPRELQDAVFPYGVGLDLALKSPGWPDSVKETRPVGASEQLDALDPQPKQSVDGEA